MKNQKLSEADSRVMPYFKKFTLPLFSFVFTILTVIRTLFANSLSSLFETWFALAFAVIFAGYLILFLCVDFTCKLLDKFFIWEYHFIRRLFLQLGAGCALPLLFLIMLCFPLFALMGINRIDNYYNLPELVRGFVAVCCANAFYVTIQYYLLFNEGMRMTKNTGVNVDLSDEISVDPRKVIYREHFEVPDGLGSQMVLVDEIAYFYRSGQDMFLITYSGNSHPFWQSLDAVSKELDPNKFFRANPKGIVGIAAVLSTEDHPDGGILLHLKVKTNEPIKVSRDKKSTVLEIIKTYRSSNSQ